MNTAKQRIKKLVDEMPETKAGEVISFLLYLKSQPEEVLYLPPEEEEIWYNIENDERMSSKEVKDLLIGEENE